MKINQRVIVFDAGDIEAESSFWAGLLDRTQAPPRGGRHRPPSTRTLPTICG